VAPLENQAANGETNLNLRYREKPVYSTQKIKQNKCQLAQVKN